MARSLTLQLVIAIAVLSLAGDVRGQVTTPEQQALVDTAMSRFQIQGLKLPQVEIVFHPSSLSCRGRKGIYRESTKTLEMCSMDQATMLHELAHAWANNNLGTAEMDAFVALRGLDSWNDHRHPWERRGTEHVAETIAWALLEESNAVKWVDVADNGTRVESFRILTLGVDVETLRQDFKMITGMDPVFRTPEELEHDTNSLSPELRRLGR